MDKRYTKKRKVGLYGFRRTEVYDSEKAIWVAITALVLSDGSRISSDSFPTSEQVNPCVDNISSPRSHPVPTDVEDGYTHYVATDPSPSSSYDGDSGD